ncbi:MAG: hypothetical protein JWL89_25 [Candidatus Saccharibacteria bacterium]|nr:hypothetical protein [Candidatus Saccharibacteria bacterium]
MQKALGFPNAFQIATVVRLGDFGDLEDSLVLTVAADFVHALLGFVADSGDFVGLLVGFDDFSGDFCLGDRRGANLDIVAVDNHQRLESSGVAISFNQLDVEGFTFVHEVLLATC